MDKDFMLHYFNKAVQSEWEKLLKTPCYQQTVCKRDTTERESFQLLGYFAYFVGAGIELEQALFDRWLRRVHRSASQSGASR